MKCRSEVRQRYDVIVQDVGGRIFLEFDGSLVSLEDLAKYRKVYIVNNLFYIYVYIVIV